MTSRGRLTRPASALVLPVGLIALWWITSNISSSFYYPPLQQVLQVLKEDWWSERIVNDLLPSMACLFIALAVAALLGVVFGAAIGSSDLLCRAMLPILDVLRSAPGVALVPIALVILGIGTKSEIGVIAFATLWPILLNVIDGVRLSATTYADVRQNLRMSYIQRLRFVDLPGSVPQFMAGLYTSLSIGVVVMVASEYYSSVRGVGFYIANAEYSFQITKTYVGVIVLGIIGYVLAIGFRCLERIVLRWRVDVRR